VADGLGQDMVLCVFILAIHKIVDNGVYTLGREHRKIHKALEPGAGA
jgi:hypothetical protein